MSRAFVTAKGSMGWLLALAVFMAGPAMAADPPCYYKNRPMPLNNAQVLMMKSSTPSGYKARGNVEGVVSAIVPDRNGHDHFIIQIGPARTDVLEVIYNQDFGALPQIHVGMRVHACGDFINSFRKNGPYPPSPAGAIIHWLHQNPSIAKNGHEHGYLSLDGVVYGLGPDRKTGRNGYDPRNIGGSFAYEEQQQIQNRRPVNRRHDKRGNQNGRGQNRQYDQKWQSSQFGR